MPVLIVSFLSCVKHRYAEPGRDRAKRAESKGEESRPDPRLAGLTLGCHCLTLSGPLESAESAFPGVVKYLRAACRYRLAASFNCCLVLIFLGCLPFLIIITTPGSFLILS